MTLRGHTALLIAALSCQSVASFFQSSVMGIIPTAERCATCTQRREGNVGAMRMADDSGGGLLGGIFGGLFGGNDVNQGLAEEILQAITREDGWLLRMEIGSEPARALGGSGKVAKGDFMTVGISARVRMRLDEGFDPPQGSAFVSDSKIFKESDGREMEGFWQVEDDGDDGVPRTIQLSLKCPEGVRVSGKEVIPGGFLYLNLRVQPPKASGTTGGPDGVRLYDGRVTVKESLDASFLLRSYKGLLAEFKIVGSCSAEPS